MPGVVVAVPWIDTKCPWRAQAREFTAAVWASYGVSVIYGVSDDKPVNRARARNAAASQVAADILFFADADMWVPEAQFLRAVALAGSTDRMVHAYTTHVKLNQATTRKLLGGATVPLLGQNVGGMSSGSFAVSRALWDSVGGQDERFLGWGGEDRAFEFACHTLGGPAQRVEGQSFHLWHPRSPELLRNTPMRKANVALAIRYKQAAGGGIAAGIVRGIKPRDPDPAAMRALLQESGGPLSARVESAHD